MRRLEAELAVYVSELFSFPHASIPHSPIGRHAAPRRLALSGRPACAAQHARRRSTENARTRCGAPRGLPRGKGVLIMNIYIY